MFWASIVGFLLNLGNFLRILIFSEITWVIAFCYTVISSINSNEINLFSNSFFIIGFASIEFSIGLLLVIIFKSNMKSINLDELSDTSSDKNRTFGKNNNYVNSFIGVKIT